MMSFPVAKICGVSAASATARLSEPAPALLWILITCTTNSPLTCSAACPSTASSSGSLTPSATFCTATRLTIMQPFLLSFEVNFDFESYFVHHQKYWLLVVPNIALYLSAIFYGRKLMSGRQGFSLRRELFVWNTVLAAFSMVGAMRTVPDIIATLWNDGLNHAICQRVNLDGYYGFWVTLFILSKVLELGDTVFIVLRKQPLIFLHWYHHTTVLFCVFFTVTRPLSTLRWYVTTNYTVHSVMYTYYALKAIGIRVPKLVAQLITTMQLTQMVIAFGITAYALVEKMSGRSCQVDDANIALAIVCYGSYFVLFGNFFIKAYLKQPDQKLDRNKNQVIDKKAV